jgi:hypothetical protein
MGVGVDFVTDSLVREIMMINKLWFHFVQEDYI